MSAITCDVLIVGGGIGGVSLGAAVAPERRVLLIEAEAQLAYHSTGRSAAVYLPSYGGGVVRALTVASRALYDELSDERGDALLQPRPLLWLSIDEASERAVHDVAAESGALQLIDTAEAVAMCPALRPERIRGAGVDAGGMEIDVAGLHDAYVKRLRRAGGTVLRSAPLRHVSRHDGGWEVMAGGDVIQAGMVVDAAGAWADDVAARAGVTGIGLSPRRRSAFLSPVHGDFGDRHRWPLVNDGLERWYFKPDGGGVLVSPADETPSEPCDAKPDELEIARAIEEINEVTTLGLRSVSHAWAGLRSFVADRQPVVGARAEDPGFFFFAGQGGYGIQMAPALAALGASILLTGSAPARLEEIGISAGAVGPARLATPSPPAGGPAPG
jgi:D-arginine dehydrogenase